MGVRTPNEEPTPEPPLWEHEDPYLTRSGDLPLEEVHHRSNVDAIIATLRLAPLLLVPIALVLFALSLAFGDVVWRVVGLLPFLYVLAIVAAPLLARLRRGSGELRLPGQAALSGPDKRRALLAALGLSGLFAAYAVYGGVWEVQAAEWLGAQVRGWAG